MFQELRREIENFEGDRRRGAPRVKGSRRRRRRDGRATPITTSISTNVVSGVRNTLLWTENEKIKGKMWVKCAHWEEFCGSKPLVPDEAHSKVLVWPQNTLFDPFSAFFRLFSTFFGTFSPFGRPNRRATAAMRQENGRDNVGK